jgi:hypothetical protein
MPSISFNIDPVEVARIVLPLVSGWLLGWKQRRRRKKRNSSEEKKSPVGQLVQAA